MTKEQINREKILCKITLYEKDSEIKPEYEQKLLKKIKMIDNELEQRESEGNQEMEFKFIGLPSYDLRVFYFYNNSHNIFLFFNVIGKSCVSKYLYNRRI